MIFFGQSEVDAKNRNQELRVRAAFRLPIDPMGVASMTDYDLVLLLCRNWFDFDDGRTAKPGLVSRWTFDEERGGYWFQISKNAKWSDGSPITSQHLIFNLKRIVNSKTSYGQSISALMSMDQIEIDTDGRFFIGTVSKKPADAFFQRMGSIFLALVHPEDLDKNGKIKSNLHSSGAFIIQSYTQDEVVLTRNQFWSGFDLSQGPQRIVIRKQTGAGSLSEFLDEKSWENITQVSSLMPESLSKKLIDKKLSMWTRDHDRVSILRPAGGANISEQQAIIKALWQEKENNLGKVKLPPGVKVAKGLQPVGYPLFQTVSVGAKEKGKVLAKSSISIGATESLTSRTQMEFLEPLFRKIGIETKWTFISKDEFIAKLVGKSDFDFLFFDFGVADPEPMTWVSLIVNMKFIYLDPQDLAEFAKISKIHNKEIEISSLKELLEEVAQKGGYVPFFHFSTLSIGHSGLSFEKIRDLDETVDYSKVIFK